MVGEGPSSLTKHSVSKMFYVFCCATTDSQEQSDIIVQGAQGGWSVVRTLSLINSQYF